MGTSLRDRRKAQTRALILDRATQILETQGFDALTMRSLAADIGVATGTLFNYFPDKASLLLATLDPKLDALHQHATSLLSSNAPASERIHAALDALLSWHVERPVLSRALHQHTLFSPKTPAAARFHARHDALAAQIAWQLGETTPHPRAAALSCISHLRFAILEGLAHEDIEHARRLLMTLRSS